ncbi:MAG: sigma-54-dependent Fis family transcriptional regulator, partial [Shewanella sp.]
MSVLNSIQDYSVLIIDDEPHIGTVLVQLFELEGIKALATTEPKGIAK